MDTITPKITGLVFELGVNNLKSVANVFVDTLGFDVVFEESKQKIFHHPKFSKDLLLRFFVSEKAVPLSEEHLLIFYLDSHKTFSELSTKLATLKHVLPISASNPYWNEAGKTFLIDEHFCLTLSKNPYKHFKARLASPTMDIGEITTFFGENLGLKKLGEFHDHDGFDGVMLGLDHLDCHLEFTHNKHVDEEAVARGFDIGVLSA